MTFARRPHWLKREPLHGDGVLLTFDDGPHPEYTPLVLDRLHRFDLRAAFFLIGERISVGAGSVSDGRSDGHLIGNHTWSHPRLGWLDFTEAESQIARCQEMLPDAKLFRPPFGRMTPGLRRSARRHGLRTMLWSLDSNDWRCRSRADADRCARELLAHLRPGDTVLLHDCHPWIVPILDIILPHVTRYALTPMCDTLEAVT
jgi:peptidoglycan/xylan/chitin deacetylase (PgdA/CDA1 family)